MLNILEGKTNGRKFLLNIIRRIRWKKKYRKLLLENVLCEMFYILLCRTDFNLPRFNSENSLTGNTRFQLTQIY